MSIEPGSEEALFNKAVTLEKIERYKEAAEIFEFLLKGNKENKDAMFELGFCYDFMDRLEESLKCYDEHLNLDPYNYNAWYNRGIVLNRMGDFTRSSTVTTCVSPSRTISAPRGITKAMRSPTWENSTKRSNVTLKHSGMNPKMFPHGITWGMCDEELGNYTEAVRNAIRGPVLLGIAANK